MKFINKINGVILEPGCEMVAEQLKKNSEYEEYKEGGEKPLSKMNKDELILTAQKAGIDVPENATKDCIIEMINAVKTE